MSASIRRFLFLLFFLSGLAGLIYQVVWTRLAFASFGIIAPVLSIVLSVFMLGLALGAWIGGRLIAVFTAKTRMSALLFYAFAELAIGLGAFVVPKFFAAGEKVLLSAGQMDSVRYLSISALVLASSILPWCLFMGTTFPFMMAYVREQEPEPQKSFSYLYLANVLGAMSGSLLSAILLIEVFGFRHTLWFAAACNFAIAAVSAGLAWKQRGSARLPDSSPRSTKSVSNSSRRPRLNRWILFGTGFIALGMEVIWARAFTPILKTQVYAFAMIVFAYLSATFLGSLFYRRDLRNNSVRSKAGLLAVTAVAAFLPILCNDLRFLEETNDVAGYLSAIVLLLTICPLCAALGYLTPRLVDDDGLGDPETAGRSYAINVLGCILGPLFASYILLPWVGERYGLILLGLPLVGFYFVASKSSSIGYRVGVAVTVSVALVCSLFYSTEFGDFISKRSPNTEIRRDYAGSVVSAGEGLNKQLFVNGIGMTALVPLTKFMAHLPLAMHTGKPKSVLLICLGMGTTYRSALAWDVETTAVELVPSVKNALGFYYADTPQILANPKGHIVIDDGRRYLERIRNQFDVIIIDPPPPVEAAGSSLLYSEEFYTLVKRRLRPYGIVNAWYPGENSSAAQAVLRSMRNSFPYLRCFRSVGGWGIHMLASMQPIDMKTPAQLAAIMPSNAADDLLEWSSSRDLAGYLAQVMSNELSVEQNLSADAKMRITDDRPFNEYFLLRKWGLLQ